ncbi:MAG TPA: sulfotransferase [Dehalococcoidia bacterium]|jgi:hypothetical protein
MLLIAGSGRSGTSAVARMLHEAGMPVGHDLIGPDESNAEGYFEERAVVEVNDAILNDVGLNAWFATASREDILRAADARGEAMAALAANATPAWKDPRFSWTLEAWLRHLAEKPRVIVCLRSPAEVVASTLRYYGQEGREPARAVEHTWRTEYERLLEIIEEFRIDAMCVEFGRLYRYPERTAAEIGEFAGLTLDASKIRRDLRHHTKRVPVRLREVYEHVRSLGRD